MILIAIVLILGFSIDNNVLDGTTRSLTVTRWQGDQSLETVQRFGNLADLDAYEVLKGLIRPCRVS